MKHVLPHAAAHGSAPLFPWRPPANRLTAFNLLRAFYLVFWLWPSSALGADYGVYTNLNTMTFSEIAPIDQIVDNEPIDFSNGELIFTYNRFELGFSWKNLRIGYLARYDYRLEFSEDTARFYFEEEGAGVRPNSPKNYDVYLDVMHQRSQGLIAHYDWQLQDNLKITPSVSLLFANGLLDGRIKGQAQFLGNNIYGGQLKLDYQYDEDFIFERDLSGEQIRGTGYTLDIAVDWRPSDHWRFHLQTFDLISYIHWRDAPRTVAVADAEPEATDDPFERYKEASIRGQESTGSFRQRITPRAQLGTSFHYRNFSIPLELYIEPERVFVFPALAYSIGRWELALLAEPRIEAFGLRVGHPWLSFVFMADRLDYEKAKFFSLGLDLRVPLF